MAQRGFDIASLDEVRAELQQRLPRRAPQPTTAPALEVVA
jgi:hypothetical protein